MYKVGDRITPLIGNYAGLVGTVTQVEERANGGITFELDDGRTGYMFKKEITKAEEQSGS